ncbi:phosphatase PAP2 family protein [Oerskovia flava]|uniref:phosphatase PAP2 family protein n=1 Tax=Oerskovia flava TaxID=2986422 RepID=UPI00223F90F2|nr:phosphatase PAP2 family protein [Oerskovia sp. JB1-3-2]
MHRTTRDDAPPRPRRRRGPVAASAVLACAAALVALWAATQLTAVGQEVDAGTFRRVSWLHDAWGEGAGHVRSSLPVVAAVVVAVLGVLAAARRAWRDLAVAAVVVVSSVGAAEAVQRLVVRPDLGGYGYAHNTFPSTNVAAVAALCVAAWILWPRSGRVALLVGAGVALLAALVSVVTYAHRPSDVVGSLLLVAAVSATVLWAAQDRSA